jgi:prepilin-type N-terminal cleavage/methylation domain-containing protein
MKGDAIDRQQPVGRAAGFTLVEVLVCLALLSILFGTVYRSFSSVNRSYTKENVKAGVQHALELI